jgi:CRISPR/Cas system-associated exonuclease Cas4 (RecB family)
MKVIRASEIGTYLFCKRAWWYQQQGYPSENKVELARGSGIHQKHGRVIASGNLLKVFAYISLLLAILAAIIWLIQLMH